jgi:hypothetical protein
VELALRLHRLEEFMIVEVTEAIVAERASRWAR